MSPTPGISKLKSLFPLSPLLLSQVDHLQIMSTSHALIVISSSHLRILLLHVVGHAGVACIQLSTWRRVIHHHFVLIAHVHVLLHPHLQKHLLLRQILLLRCRGLLLALHLILLHLIGRVL